MSSKKIFKEIWSYFKLQNEISKYFNEGINFEPNEEKQTLYFINPYWIESWKIYTKYDTIIKKGNNYDSLKERGYLNYGEDYNLCWLNTGDLGSNFSEKLQKRKDFDCLVDKNTFELFKRYSDNKWGLKLFGAGKNFNKIDCIFYDKMFVLISEKHTELILYSRFIKEPNDELIQLTFTLPEFKEKAFDGMKMLIDFITNKQEDKNDLNYFFLFQKQYLDTKNKRENLIKILTEELQMDIKPENNIKVDNRYIPVKNNNLLKKKIVATDNLEQLISFLDNVKIPRFIGLENIGATCYMNATLQCLVNVGELTNYLLKENNFSHILKNIEKCELLSSYCRLLVKLCCDKNVKKYFAPKNFKNILSLKNPLFEGIQANDSKDLIYFLLEHINYELNMINLKINENLQKSDNINIVDEINQANKDFMFTSFIKEYSSENNNIITKTFFSLLENESICNGCNTHKFNYQITFSLEMPLETIYNKIYGNQSILQEKKKLNLIECISNYNETSYFTGENAMYCNYCKRQENSTYYKRMHSLSPILIIILNRGKANQFDCDVDFQEKLNFQQYILNPNINYSYNLIGVVTHFGTSDMGGHFIAYCRHRITKEWYCYNDATVSKLTDQKNGYKNGVPYILFYESEQGNNNILFDYFNNKQNLQNTQNYQTPFQNFYNNGFLFNNGNNKGNSIYQNNLNTFNINNNINYNGNNNGNMNTLNNNFQNTPNNYNNMGNINIINNNIFPNSGNNLISNNIINYNINNNNNMINQNMNNIINNGAINNMFNQINSQNFNQQINNMNNIQMNNHNVNCIYNQQNNNMINNNPKTFFN